MGQEVGGEAFVFYFHFFRLVVVVQGRCGDGVEEDSGVNMSERDGIRMRKISLLLKWSKAFESVWPLTSYFKGN